MSHLQDQIFVVGAPRSGTTLLASMLAAHPSIISGQETQLLNKLSSKDLRRCTSDNEWPRQAVAALMGVTLSGERVVDLFGLAESDLVKYLSGQPHTVGAMFAAFFEAADRLPAGRRWLEKTPNHLIRVDTIMRAFPHARIVRIVRDPRDVAQSLSRVPWAPDSLVANAWDWRQRYAQSRAGVAAHDASITTVRYEDLLTAPGDILRQVCAHIGVEFDEKMLAPELSVGSLTTSVEPWKVKNSSELDPTRAYSWKRTRGPANHAISLLCSNEIQDLGYSDAIAPASTVSAFIPSAGVAALLDEYLITTSARGARVVDGSHLQPEILYVPAVIRLVRARLYRAALRVSKVRAFRAFKRLPTATMRRNRVPTVIQLR